VYDFTHGNQGKTKTVDTKFMKTFLDYPQRQQPGSFNVDIIMQQLEAARAAGQ